jgi:hypothetical protein
MRSPPPNGSIVGRTDPDRKEASMHRLIPTTLAAFALAAATAASAGAAAPQVYGPFFNEYSDVGMHCDGFDVLIQGSGTDTFTVFTDANGQLAKVLYRARYPHDTLTNTLTGESIVVRGEFQETLTPIAGTDEFTKTITGFRYLVNQPGAGVTIRDVGRITYGDLEQTLPLWEAGKHDLVLDEQIESTFCAALA